MATKTATTTRKAPAKKKAAAKKTNGTMELSLAEEQAASLAQAALWIDQATTAQQLGGALEHNMNVWVGIRAMVKADGCPLPEAIKDNLLRLSDYVTKTTLSAAQKGLTGEQLKSLVNVNLQISEGLLEGHAMEQIRQEAYRMWQADGAPDGKDQEYWFLAEKAVRKEMETGQEAAFLKA